MDYFPKKSLSKYVITDTIDFNKHVHDINIFINDKWRKYAGGVIERLQNYKAIWTSLLTNEKVKSTFTRRLLRPNRPLTWALCLDCIGGVMDHMLTSSTVDHRFKPLLCQTNAYEIGICCFFAKHEALRSYSKTCWVRIRIMCPSGATCLPTDCFFSELPL